MPKATAKLSTSARQKPTAKQAVVDQVIRVPKFDIRTLHITLIGDEPLICHRWDEKVIREMEDKLEKRARAPQEARNPEQEFRNSLYEYPGGGYGFPAIAFKSAAVDACSMIPGITKVEARGTFHINGELVRIIGPEPVMRRDMVKIGMGTATPRYRGQFTTWAAKFPLRYNAGILSSEQIVNLFNVAGFSIGIGEWRAQRDGSKGLFHVQREGEKLP